MIQNNIELIQQTQNDVLQINYIDSSGEQYLYQYYYPQNQIPIIETPYNGQYGQYAQQTHHQIQPFNNTIPNNENNTTPTILLETNKQSAQKTQQTEFFNFQSPTETMRKNINEMKKNNCCTII